MIIAMRKKRPVGLIVVAVFALYFLCSFGLSTLQENGEVKMMYNRLFVAIREQDHQGVKNAFGTTTLPLVFFPMMFEHKLLGWKYVSVGGQPWPMDQIAHDVPINVIFYYAADDKSKNSPLAHYPKITDREFGPCIAEPMQLSMFVDATRRGHMTPPDLQTGRCLLWPHDAAKK